MRALSALWDRGAPMRANQLTVRRLPGTATTLLVGLFVAMFLTWWSAAPAGAAPRTLHCGDTIARDTTVVLTHDLRCPDGDGISMLPGSVLDLGGHSLIGPGRTVPGT